MSSFEYEDDELAEKQARALLRATLKNDKQLTCECEKIYKSLNGYLGHQKKCTFKIFRRKQRQKEEADRRLQQKRIQWAVEAEVRSEIDSVKETVANQENVFDESFSHIDGEMTSMNARISSNNTTISTNSARISSNNTRISSNNTRISSNNAKITSLESRTSSYDARISSIEDHIQILKMSNSNLETRVSTMDETLKTTVAEIPQLVEREVQKRKKKYNNITKREPLKFEYRGDNICPGECEALEGFIPYRKIQGMNACKACCIKNESYRRYRNIMAKKGRLNEMR